MEYIKNGVEFLSKNDEKLIPYLSVIENHIFPEPTGVFESLIRSIISQQLSTKVAEVILNRLKNLFSGFSPSPEEILLTDHEALRSIGLSNNKANYIRNIAEFFSNEEVKKIDWHTMPDDEIVDLLIQIKGVGTWTIKMILLFSLERSDIWPINDLGIQQGFKKLIGCELLGKELLLEMEKYSERWKPYRSVVAMCFWKVKDEKTMEK